ncbi:MAG: response regulator [bacterium]|nr:response regulator [bacterium]
MNNLKYDVRWGADTYHAISGRRLQGWIRSGKIQAGEVVVWRSGLSGWRKVEEMEELAPFFNMQEPPLANMPDAMPTPSQSAAQQGTIATILLVDDEKDLCWLLSEALTHEGYSLHTANTKRKALALLAKDAPDMVILDLQLPDGNGMSIIPAIRKVSTKTLICIASAYGTAAKKEEAKAMGVAYFIDKPFGIETILNIIR